jgi:hypothetical protein
MCFSCQYNKGFYTNFQDCLQYFFPNLYFFVLTVPLYSVFLSVMDSTIIFWFCQLLTSPLYSVFCQLLTVPIYSGLYQLLTVHCIVTIVSYRLLKKWTKKYKFGKKYWRQSWKFVFWFLFMECSIIKKKNISKFKCKNRDSKFNEDIYA